MLLSPIPIPNVVVTRICVVGSAASGMKYSSLSLHLPIYLTMTFFNKRKRLCQLSNRRYVSCLGSSPLDHAERSASFGSSQHEKKGKDHFFLAPPFGSLARILAQSNFLYFFPLSFGLCLPFLAFFVISYPSYSLSQP